MELSEKNLLNIVAAATLSASQILGSPIDKVRGTEERPRLYDSINVPLPEDVREEVSTSMKVSNHKKIDVEDSGEEELEISYQIEEILRLIPFVKIDAEGKLLYMDETTFQEKEVSTIETVRHQFMPYEEMKEVKFFVVHYDGAPLLLNNGEYRTAQNTINGLNRTGLPSVQYCVDPYVINNNPVDVGGYGIIQSQKPNDLPYQGNHVLIGVDSEGNPDNNYIRTSKVFKQIGISSELIDFANERNTDFDSFAIGAEQVGTDFSKYFPVNFPPNQEMANMVALIKAVSNRYALGIWDILSHEEIQQKADPGHEYMLTIRYAFGIMYIFNKDSLPDNFLRDNPKEYFRKLREYAIEIMGEERYEKWDSIYDLDRFIDSLNTVKRDSKRLITKDMAKID